MKELTVDERLIVEIELVLSSWRENKINPQKNEKLI